MRSLLMSLIPAWTFRSARHNSLEDGVRSFGGISKKCWGHMLVIGGPRPGPGAGSGCKAAKPKADVITSIKECRA
jgi:hypothetical protein